MGEICIEHCAPKKNYLHFNPEMGLDFAKLPKLSIDEYGELTGPMKGKWLFVLLTKIMEELNGEYIRY